MFVPEKCPRGGDRSATESFTLIEVLVVAAVVSVTTPAEDAEPQVAFGVKVE